jgi:predicted GH43/DUF377 family glycosyl hydrolase
MADETALPTPAAVDSATMQRVYEEVKTPHKYGVVLAEEGRKVDSPSVYFHGGRWYMGYIVFDGAGYETCLAVSDDLLRREKLGTLLAFTDSGWDAQQKAGYFALQDTTWGGTATLEQHDGHYWMSYLGGALKGYETDPLSIGIAWSNTVDAAAPWERLPEPVLGPADADARFWERLTLYKSNVVRDPEARLGHPFVMYYNAKTESGYERIGMAVSDDMRAWQRFGGGEPLIDNGSGISGDPQVVRMGDLWVMFYFGAFYRPKAFDTFAVSRDLVHWTTWDGPDLVAPSEPWDETYAHKPWLIKHDGVVYHFYCAVGSEGRVIALATSKDMRARD